jgi:hypothetical protein
MRTSYLIFSDRASFISNIFHYENEWRKPNNFIIPEILQSLIIPEILYSLGMNRKRIGQIGIGGYFTVEFIANETQKRGIDFDDAVTAMNYLLSRGLILADHMGTSSVGVNDCVKISAAGYSSQNSVGTY